MNNPFTSPQVKAVIKNLPKNKSPEPGGFTREFNQIFSEGLILNLLKLFQKFVEKETLPNSFYKATKTRQRQHKKRKISLMNVGSKWLHNILANIILQHIKKLIHHDQVGFIPGMQRFFNICKSINVLHHIDKLKDKNHMIKRKKSLTKFSIH